MNILLVIVGRTVQFLVLLLSVKISTSLLSPADIGEIALVTSSVAFFSLAFLSPAGQYMNRMLNQWNDKGVLRNSMELFWAYLFFISLMSVAILYFMHITKIWVPQLNFNWFVAIVFGNLIFGTVNQVAVPNLNLLGYQKWFIGLTVATSLMSLLFAYFLVENYMMNAVYWLCGLLLGQILVGLIGMIIFYQKIKKNRRPYEKISKANMKEVFRFCWPIALAVSLGWTQNQSYRFIMESNLGFKELGIFVAGYGISAGMMSGFESILSTYFHPIFLKKIEEVGMHRNTDTWSTFANIIFPSQIISMCLIISIAPELTRLLLGPAFAGSENYLIWGAVAEVLRMALGVFTMASYAQMDTKMLIMPNLVGAFICIISVWILTPIFGAVGVSVSLVASGLATLLCALYITSLAFKIKISLFKIALCFLAGGAMIFGCQYLRSGLTSMNGNAEIIFMLFLSGTSFLFLQYIFSFKQRDSFNNIQVRNY